MQQFTSGFDNGNDNNRNDNDKKHNIEPVDIDSLGIAEAKAILKRIQRICEISVNDLTLDDTNNRMLVISEILGINQPHKKYRGSYTDTNPNSASFKPTSSTPPTRFPPSPPSSLLYDYDNNENDTQEYNGYNDGDPV